MAKSEKLMILGIPFTTMLGIIACFGDDAVGASINPALASIAVSFPEIPYSQVLWLYSMPKIVIIPTILIAGLLIGRRVSYRVAAITGFALIAIGGMAPIFLDDFWAILATRFICGIGLGIQSPIGPALVLRYFSDPQKRATVLGIGHGFVNIYGVLTNLLVGFLCAIDWHLAFAAYGTILILLVIAILFLKEPASGDGKSALQLLDANAEETKMRELAEGGMPISHSDGRRMPISVLVLCIIYLLTMTLWGVAGLNLSAIIMANGFGDAAVSGTVISLINVSGVIAGFAFGKLNRIFKSFVLPFGYFLMAVGFAIYFFAPNVIVLGCGLFIAGLANTVIMTAFESEVGLRCGVSFIAMGMSMCMMASQLSGFITPFYISFVMDTCGLASYSAPLAFSAVMLTILGVCFMFYFVARRRAAR